MKLKFNSNDFQRIKSKLEKLNDNLNSVKFQWRIDLLNEYKEKVSSMMGSVSGRGGYPNIEIKGITNTKHWNALQPATILSKTGAAYNSDNMHNVYSEWAVKTTIWENTGRTKNSFAIEDNWVGVNSSYAWKVEEGDPNNTYEGNEAPIKPRPLFSLANYIIEIVVHRACTDPNNDLGNRIRKELKDYIGWGQ